MQVRRPSAPNHRPTTSISAPSKIADVLAAAIAYRATDGNGWVDPDHFRAFYIVRRLGHADAEGFISGFRQGPRLTPGQGAAIEAALTPRTVTWVRSPKAVRGDQQKPRKMPDRTAIIIIAEPAIDGDRARVASELWCDWLCALGSTSVLERRNGVWKVTEDNLAYVS
jgi:hypothetical protein